MKITAIKYTPFNIPLEAPFHWTGGLYPGGSKVLIEVETDEGIVGYGEAPSVDVLPTLKEMSEALVGMDPIDIAACEMRVVPPWQITANTDDSTPTEAFGAIEMALWDIRGKAWDQPLYKLLGGAVRKEIAFTEYFSFRPDREMDEEAIADYCVRMREEHGSTYFEGKLILGDPHLELRTVKRLREVLGEAAMIRLDSNMQYSLQTARCLLRELEPYNISNYEDPVTSFEEMAILRQHTSIPFSTHVPDVKRAASLGAPDNIVTNFAVLGGINRAMRFFGACEAANIGFWCYSGDAGVCTAAYLHVSAAMPWLFQPAQSLFRWQYIDVIEGGPFRQTNNVIPVPEGPGLGITIDRDNLKRMHQDFVDNGHLNHFHNPKDPKRHCRLPLA